MGIEKKVKVMQRKTQHNDPHLPRTHLPSTTTHNTNPDLIRLLQSSLQTSLHKRDSLQSQLTSSQHNTAASITPTPQDQQAQVKQLLADK